MPLHDTALPFRALGPRVLLGRPNLKGGRVAALAGVCIPALSLFCPLAFHPVPWADPAGQGAVAKGGFISTLSSAGPGLGVLGPKQLGAAPLPGLPHLSPWG